MIHLSRFLYMNAGICIGGGASTITLGWPKIGGTLICCGMVLLALAIAADTDELKTMDYSHD